MARTTTADNFIDCEDKDCCSLVTCGATTYCGKGSGTGGTSSGGSESTVALCTDGKDNDGDKFIDCEDSGCCSVVTCGATTYCGKKGSGGTGGTSSGGSENTVALCTDGKDNDGDNFIDCEDKGCCSLVTCGATTYCGKQGTGGTGGTGSSGSENTLSTCSDKKDNDGDGFTDCDDFDCCSLIDCKTDFPASSCATKGSGGTSSGGSESTVALCTDGKDNDGDKFHRLRGLGVLQRRDLRRHDLLRQEGLGRHGRDEQRRQREHGRALHRWQGQRRRQVHRLRGQGLLLARRLQDHRAHLVLRQAALTRARTASAG